MAMMTIDELRQLKNKAASYCANSGSTECKWLYRNKSDDYFQKILVKHHGTMRPIIKDNSGDQRSPINGKLKGLFFMATHEDGEPLPTSAFGPVRLLIPACDLLARCPNVYFTDFYCMQGNWHYVTLVVTSSQSGADSFCRRNLLALDMRGEAHNPFLFYHYGQLYVSQRSYFHVEVFYTDDIRLFRPGAEAMQINMFNSRLLVPRGAQWMRVQTFGRGSSTPGGLRKNTSCLKCNLSIKRRSSFTSDSDADSDPFQQLSRSLSNRRRTSVPVGIRSNAYQHTPFVSPVEASRSTVGLHSNSGSTVRADSGLFIDSDSFQGRRLDGTSHFYPSPTDTADTGFFAAICSNCTIL